MMIRVVKFLVIVILLTSCQSNFNSQSERRNLSPINLKIPYQKYRLNNGLTIILHEDHSDPIVAFATIIRAGSSRESLGKTGFAHFFEHMAFNDSENVPRGANRKMIEELGGQRNGGTWADGTYYYELVPKDALEKVMWINSDRLGYMINTVTQRALEIEKQVVKNEKRQRVDNQPYGHTHAVISKNLYPPTHPYHWTVLGDLDDLQSSSLTDVKEFYQKYYGPQNTTLVIAGDFDSETIKPLIKKWYGEITPLTKASPLLPMPANLKQTKKIFHLDNFAKVPELTLTFPTVEQYHPDAYALELLAQILGRGLNAPLFDEIVSRRNLASLVTADQFSTELAGTLSIQVRANKDIDLDEVYEAIQIAFNRFEKSTINLNDLQSLKLTKEIDIYQNLQSVLDKALQLGISQTFTNDPMYLTKEIQLLRQVTLRDIARVYKTYLKDKPYVLTSFVPKRQSQLTVENSRRASIAEEDLSVNLEDTTIQLVDSDYQKTPTKFNRKEPPLGNKSNVQLPHIQAHTFNNGLKILNIEHNEMPLINFKFRIDGGAWLESLSNIGSANLLADMLNEATKSKNIKRIHSELGRLGSKVKITAAYTSIDIQGSSLSIHFAETMKIVNEMLLKPQFTSLDFRRVKNRQLNLIKQLEADSFSIAERSFNRQAYGENHRLSFPVIGTQQSVSRLRLSDIRQFYKKAISPQNTALHVSGKITQKEILDSINPLFGEWKGPKLAIPSFQVPLLNKKPTVFFVDIPNAKQSVIYAGKPALRGNHPEYFRFHVAQNRLGGGSSSQLFQALRIAKGYTYGAYSRIEKAQYKAPFVAYSQVRTNVTLESLEMFRDLIKYYPDKYSLQDLAITKNQLQKKRILGYETLLSLVDLLDEISRFNLPLNYIEQITQELQDMSVEQVKQAFREHANEQQMIYVVVGDAETQLHRVKQFGYGEPIILDRNGGRLR